MIIQREQYIKELLSKRWNGKVKIITGIRRCGKSFLLSTLYKDYLKAEGVSDECFVEIALDKKAHVKYRNPNELYNYVLSKTQDVTKRYYVFIDEAQYAITREEMKNPDIPIRLYGVLNGLLRKENVDVYVTGSNSKFLSTDIMTEFRGRGDEVHIAPLSFSEFYPASGKTQAEAWNEYLYYGGLPYILSEHDDESKSLYLERLNSEIYLRDICERYDLRDAHAMQSVMKVISSSVGSLSNAQKIYDTFRSSGDKNLSMPTISNYLRYLQQSFLIQKAERYNIKGRKYIGTPSKYYYTDLGLRNALLNFRQFEKTHLMENAIYNELIYRGFKVDVGIVEIRLNENEKTHRKQLEVDFVVNRAGQRYYIQSAFSLPDSEKLKQEQASLIHIPDSFKKIIVVGDDQKTWRNEYGITITGIYEFMLNENSLDI